MMTPETARDAAVVILSAWNAGNLLDALPEPIRPRTPAEGFAVQLAVTAASGDRRAGWKIAATSAAGQTHIGVDGPLPGTLLSKRVQPAPGRFSLAHNQMRVAEAEFAFRLGRDLPPRPEPYTIDEVLDAVATLHPAIEVPNSRYRDYARVGAAQLIADNACADDFTFGPATAADWRTIDLAAHPVEARVNGQVAQIGRGSNVLGDPRIALTWLANALSGFGAGLKTDEIVTTGTCVIPFAVAAGDAVMVDFGVIGRIEAQFHP